MSVISACFFEAISGSGPATMAAVGSILIPAMEKPGYRKSMSAGLLATAGGIGIIILPSIAYIVYGVIAEVSIGKLFIAGIIPGLIMGLTLAIMWYVIAKREKIQTMPKATRKELWTAFREAFWGLMAPVIFLGGIYSGIVGIFIYKEISWSNMPAILLEATKTTAMIMLIVAAASSFAWLITVEGIAEEVANGILSLVSNKLSVLLMMNIILLLAGMFVDAISAYYIFLPIIIPILAKMHIDPIHFGVVMTMNLAIGLVTPPVGLDLYVACGLAKISLKEISKGVIPFIIAALIALAIVTYIPENRSLNSEKAKLVPIQLGFLQMQEENAGVNYGFSQLFNALTCNRK